MSNKSNIVEINKEEHDNVFHVKKVSNFVDDGSGNIIRQKAKTFDSINNGLSVIDTAHLKIHDGEFFSHSNKHSVSSGNSFDILIKIPSNVTPHLRYGYSVENAPGDLFLYEAPTTTADGSQLVVRCVNRNSSNISGVTIFSSPTVTDVGTILQYNFMSGSFFSGGSTESLIIEWILKPNTNYLIRYTNNSIGTSDLSHSVIWYE